MFIQVSLVFLGGNIESLLIHISLDINTRDIYMLSLSTEPFMICIPVLQCTSSGIIDSTLHMDDPGRVFKTIKIRALTVK